jgi:hypothetical protein
VVGIIPIALAYRARLDKNGRYDKYKGVRPYSIWIWTLTEVVVGIIPIALAYRA